ncbi:MAG: cytochrome c biogenesis protein CcdA [Myxococcaceae bacterium]
MKRSTVLTLATLGAVGLVFVPSLIPAGPSSSLDASSLLNSGRLAVAVGVIFLGGFLTSLTPCVYPLIPITVGVFGARQADSRGRALLLTTSYVVGMGVVFSALGVFAALSGRAFGSVLGNSWVVVGLAVFMLVLATSMFGAFDLALPSSLATKLNGVGGGGFVGAFLMGSVAGFLAAPCTGPVLTGVLAWVSQTRDPVLGAGLLFVYALGIGVPFFLIGVFTVRMPKSGVWMEWVKSVFGIALLALAFTYLRDGFPVIGDAVSSAASAIGRTGVITLAAALAFIGVLAGAIHLSFKEGNQWLLKGAGVALVLVGFALRMAAPIPVAPLPPVTPVAGNDPTPHPPTEFVWAVTLKLDEKTPTAESFDKALAQARLDCKPVMIDFFADWCAACKELDHLTYTSPLVQAEAERFVKVKVDGTEDHEVLDELYKKFGVQGLPTVAFVDPMGEQLKDPKVTGFLPPDKFVTELKKVQIATCSRTP